jgi:prepilin-type N-terminal cleavage/methylation domain-containing protein
MITTPELSSSATRQKAFSLVELSIVLVILGLLVGGVLSGQSLIRAAEIRSLATDVVRYRTAALTFRDKYFYWPGDLPNATSFWGIAAGSTGNDNTCFDMQSTTTATCNGTGDGAIGIYGFTQWESYRFWQHLANAGLIEGRYSGAGINGSGATQYGCVATNCPSFKTRRATMIPTQQNSNGDSDFAPYPLANYFLLGNFTVNGVPGGFPIGAIVSTEEAWNIDTKIDDGLPYQGFFQTHYRAGSAQWGAQETNACASSSTIAGATYNLTKTGNACAFRINFQ